MKHYVGIDNANLAHEAVIINEDEKIVKRLSFQNNASGFTRLKATLKQYSVWGIAFELPHGPIVDALRETKYRLYCLNPLKVKRFKEILSVSRDKNDKLDSLAIARYLKANQANVQMMVFNSAEVEEIKVLSLSYDRLQKEKVRYANRLLFVIRYYLPVFEFLFTNMACKTSLKLLLKYPTWAALGGESHDEIRKFLRSHKYNNPKSIYQSGGYQKVIMRRACNKVARNILWNLAFCTLSHSTWARQYYDQQRKRGKRHSVAIRALSNKWLKILFAIWTRRESYDENRNIYQVA